MPRAKREVQIPGEAPASTADQAASAPDASSETSTDTAAAEPAPKAKGKGSAFADPLTVADYATMHSSQVDAKTLTRSVLCKDGWVVPIAPPQPAQRA